MKPAERKMILRALLALVESAKPETRTPPRKGPTVAKSPTAREFVRGLKARQIGRVA